MHRWNDRLQWQNHVAMNQKAGDCYPHWLFQSYRQRSIKLTYTCWCARTCTMRLLFPIIIPSVLTAPRNPTIQCTSGVMCFTCHVLSGLISVASAAQQPLLPWLERPAVLLFEERLG